MIGGERVESFSDWFAPGKWKTMSAGAIYRDGAET